MSSKYVNRASRFYLGDQCPNCGGTSTFIEAEGTHNDGGCYTCSRPFKPTADQIKRSKNKAASWHF